jgi:hypothetical protein
LSLCRHIFQGKIVLSALWLFSKRHSAKCHLAKKFKPTLLLQLWN